MSRSFLLLLPMMIWLGGAASPSAAAPHDDARVRCLDCHVTLLRTGAALRFHVDIQPICLGCHGVSCRPRQTGGEYRHPVSVAAPFPLPADMPVDEHRRIGCITCHLFHEGNRAGGDLPADLLRRPSGPTFCTTCHRKLLLP